jgi:hypothetical protein
MILPYNLTALIDQATATLKAVEDYYRKKLRDDL